MANGIIRISRAKVMTQMESLRQNADTLPSGRGEQLGPIIRYVLDRVQKAVDDLDDDTVLADSLAEDSVDRAALLNITAQRFQRLVPQLGVVHTLIAEYGKSVGRSDVPVGLQHLVDLLIQQILPTPGDPIIHSQSTNMYSTIDLVALTDHLLNRAGETSSIMFTGMRPIVFNLPALDSANALLSPVLAHEVAHTAVNESLLNKLFEQSDEPKIEGMLQIASEALGWDATRQGEIDALVRQYRGWCNELLSDAVALVLTGPSFLWAFSAFAPPSNLPSVTTHPSERDRARFHLDLLARLGWTPFLELHAPGLTAWFHEIASTPVLTHSPQETFLRSALEAVTDLAGQIAIEHVADGLLKPEFPLDVAEPVSWVSEGVPMVEFNQTVLTPWQIILIGWLSAIKTRGDDPQTLPEAVGDVRFNALLVKMLEHSSVAAAWREYERVAA